MVRIIITQARNHVRLIIDGTYFQVCSPSNIREMVRGDREMWQVLGYYPFGTPLCDHCSAINPDYQPFKYNGKEFDMMHGLNTYDYGARLYYSVIPAWDRMDPLCEKYYSVSPYAYCHNTPVLLMDPDGRDDYFAFLRHTDEGNNILIQTADSNYANITHVDFSRQTGVLTNIGNHYLSIVDHNYTLTIGQAGDNVPLEAGMANIQGTGKYILYINAEGKVNFVCNSLYFSTIKLQQITLITEFTSTYNSSNSYFII